MARKRSFPSEPVVCWICNKVFAPQRNYANRNAIIRICPTCRERLKKPRKSAMTGDLRGGPGTPNPRKGRPRKDRWNKYEKG